MERTILSKEEQHDARTIVGAFTGFPPVSDLTDTLTRAAQIFGRRSTYLARYRHPETQCNQTAPG